MMPLVIENQLISLGYHVVFHCFLAMIMYEYHLQKKKIIVLNFISLSIIIMRIFFLLFLACLLFWPTLTKPFSVPILRKKNDANDHNPIIGSISRNLFAQKKKKKKNKEKKENDLDDAESVTRDIY
jgi:hypothetical protein